MKIEQFRLMTDSAQQRELDALEEKRGWRHVAHDARGDIVPMLSVSLRDWFAGEAMQAMVQHWAEWWNLTQGPGDGEGIVAANARRDIETGQLIGRRAYDIADAMLEAREKPGSA